VHARACVRAFNGPFPGACMRACVRVCDCYQVAELISSMAFIRDPDGATPPKPVAHTRPVPKLRFRAAVIAIIAADRFVSLSSASCRLCTVVDSVALGPAHCTLCIGYVPSVGGMSSLSWLEYVYI